MVSAEWIEEEAIDGEVAALDVFSGGFGVADFIGMTTVRVNAIVAEGGDFGDAALGDGTLFAIAADIRGDEDYAEVSANGEGAGKHGENNIGSCRGSDIVVLRFAAEEKVANASTSEVGIVACRAQSANDRNGCFELGRLWHALSSRIVRRDRLAGEGD